MTVEILMPALSPTMEEGTLAKWLKKEGDTISAGEVIAEIETDKATMEFEAVDEGTLGRIVVAEGTEGVKVNQVIAVLLEDGESADDIGEVAANGGGDGRGDGDPDDTAQAAAQAPAEGYGREPSPKATLPDGKAPPAPQKDGERVFASPLARRIAADRGIDLGSLRGSGPRGRIVRADVEGAEPSTTPEAAAAAAPPSMSAGPAAEQVMKAYADRAFTEVALDNMRKTVAKRLVEAKQTIPHFYLRRDIRLDALLDLRKRMNASGEARGIKLSVNDFVIKASAMALQDVPGANAVWARDRILQLEASDVAVAVAVEGGLFTPVIRDAETKTLSQLSAEMKDLAERARNRRLAPHEYQGGSFAISNLGMFGIDSFDAVINPPHASILAVGAGTRRPVVGDDGSLATATVMTVTLSVDHRVIDGALGAEFLAAVVRLIEDPVAMLM